MTGAAEPRAGQVWSHRKGGRYAVLHVAVHSETGERLVIYRSLSDGDGSVAARPLAMWTEVVEGRPRFVLDEQDGRAEAAGAA